MTEQERFMKEAIRQAKKARALEEVPIGCVIVSDGRNTDKNTLSHAELNAIRKASKKLGDWRLEGCTMYVTLEPCQMCAGALVQSRIDEVVIGSMNPKAGCAGSVLNLLQVDNFNHQVKITRGVLEEECSMMLSDFFRELREKKKRLKMLAKQQAEQERRSDRDTWSGRMCPEHSVATRAKTSRQSSKKSSASQTKNPMYLSLRRENGRQQDVSWATISPSLGECLMPNTGECPKEESVSTLSQILEETPHQKYYLSEKACLGILRRAEKRGKELPEILRLALIRQAQMMSSAMTSATGAE